MLNDSQIIHVTVDTNIVREAKGNQDNVEVVKELLALSENGRLVIAFTIRINCGILRQPLSDRIGELLALTAQRDRNRISAGHLLLRQQ